MPTYSRPRERTRIIGLTHPLAPEQQVLTTRYWFAFLLFEGWRLDCAGLWKWTWGITKGPR